MGTLRGSETRASREAKWWVVPSSFAGAEPHCHTNSHWATEPRRSAADSVQSTTLMTGHFCWSVADLWIMAPSLPPLWQRISVRLPMRVRGQADKFQTPLSVVGIRWHETKSKLGQMTTGVASASHHHVDVSHPNSIRLVQMFQESSSRGNARNKVPCKRRGPPKYSANKPRY
jgi:hypothetical protein